MKFKVGDRVKCCAWEGRIIARDRVRYQVRWDANPCPESDTWEHESMLKPIVEEPLTEARVREIVREELEPQGPEVVDEPWIVDQWENKYGVGRRLVRYDKRTYTLETGVHGEWYQAGNELYLLARRFEALKRSKEGK